MIRKWIFPALLFLAAVTGCTNKSTVEGTYLVNGISALVSIEKKDDSLSINAINAVEGFPLPQKAVFRKNCLFLVFMSNMGNYNSFTAVKMRESRDIPGDWDLTGATKSGCSANEDTAMENIVEMSRPFASFLHRADDPNLKSYFENMETSSNKQSICDMEKAAEILRQNPEDPYYRIFYLDCLMRKEKWLELEKKLSEWRKSFDVCPNQSITYFSKALARAVEGHKLSKEGQNASDYFMKLSSMNPGDSYVSLLEKASLCRGNIPREKPPSMMMGPIPDFLGGQVCAKVLRMESIFAMLKGDNQRALHLLTLTYRMGQIYRGKTNMISNLVGIAVWAITESGMEMYILNACRTPDDLREFFMNLRELRKKDQSLHYDDYMELENPIAAVFAPVSLEKHGEEVRTRWNVGEARANLLLSAAAARYGLLTIDKFPVSSADFSPLLTTGLPKDPFIKESVRFIEKMDSFVLYSMGPDQKDDSAAFPYDPTNGAISSGDIFIEIPRMPKYPFPKKDGLATTKEGLSRQFPNGLPPDVFHDNRNASLTIIDSVPAKIVSFGPDTDSNRAAQGSLLPLDSPYDPTNGVVSNGDLILDTGL
ncbi:hypothetical protein JW926_14815 [Candidatus Sumerlaeota bacterium]|nr:hypothetical protein [Candidatus Sumerlaeota bacterium]